MGGGKKIRMAIAWKWFPFYAAKLIGESRLADQGFAVTLLGTKSARPFGDLSKVAKYPIHWLEDGKRYSWQGLGLEPPDLLIITGWAEQSFISLARDAQKVGTRCISMVDNRWRGDFRQLVGALVFRLRFRPLFDAVWVPGDSGQRLMKFFGMPESRIFTGLYGADPTVFTSGPPLQGRPKAFIFVGALIPRKGLGVLAGAWRRFFEKHPDWTLNIYGNGEAAQELLQLSGASVHPFVQPEELPEVLAKHRFLVLPSFDENWGLVVHEAVCCGCGVIASSVVGSAADLLTLENGRIFDVGSSDALHNALVEMASLSEDALAQVDRCNSEKRSLFGPAVWEKSVKEIMDTLQCGRTGQ